MSKKDIQKNFKLSEDFNNYVIKNPKIIKGIPENACIVMTSKNDPELTDKNIKLAERVVKKERKPCFKAVKRNRKWILEPVVI